MQGAPFHRHIPHTAPKRHSTVDPPQSNLSSFYYFIGIHGFSMCSWLRIKILDIKPTLISLTIKDLWHWQNRVSFICRVSQWAKDWLCPESRSFLLIEMMGKGWSEWGRRSLWTCWPPTTHWGSSCSWLWRGRPWSVYGSGFPELSYRAAYWRQPAEQRERITPALKMTQLDWLFAKPRPSLVTFDTPVKPSHPPCRIWSFQLYL